MYNEINKEILQKISKEFNKLNPNYTLDFDLQTGKVYLMEKGLVVLIYENKGFPYYSYIKTVNDNACISFKIIKELINIDMMLSELEDL